MPSWRDKSFSERRKETENFNHSVSGDALEAAIEWISENLTVDNVFGDQQIIEWVSQEKNPGDVFKFESLAEWAEENGYTKQ